MSEVSPRIGRVSRRTFLALGAAVVVGPLTSCRSGDDSDRASTSPAGSTSPPAESTATAAPVTSAPASTAPATTEPPPTTISLAADPFLLGVTAGDADATSVVLWTRLVGDGLPDSVDVTWEIGPVGDPAAVTASGIVTASGADGHSVHVVVPIDGPVAYRFRAGGFTSPAGRAAPAIGGDSLRLASASCQHFETGFYAAHRDLAAWQPDAVVFLGDFIYEGAGLPVGDGRVRSHDGPEPTDLAGYRARYAQYLSDADLQAARAACPWYVVWDDHEVENDYASLTPEVPADAAGFPARRAAAYRAWWEHMPVRLPPPVDGADDPIYRTAAFGGLLDLVLLDGRQYRSDQACGNAKLSVDPPCPEAAEPARTMLGATQEAWLGETLANSTATWTLLGQQTVLSDLRLPNGAILNPDQWDGYAPARDRLLAQAAPVAGRLLVLTGDIHLAGVGTLPGIGTEFVTTSISSDARIPAELQPFVETIESIVDAELAHRGYTRHTVTPATWTAEYRIVDNVDDPASAVSTWRTFTVAAGASDTLIG